MKKFFFEALIVLALLSGATQAAEKLSVVTTIPDLKSLAEFVGGEHVKAVSIASGNEDPHFLQAKPSYMVIAHKADLWIRVGLELEIGWEGPILDGARNSKIRVGQPGFLDASEGVPLLEVPTGRVTREMGDVHPMGNPHYWLDPYNGRIIARNIADRLARLDPKNAGDYSNNLLAFQKNLDEQMFGKDLVAKVGGEQLWAAETKGNLAEYLKAQNLSQALGGWKGKTLPFQGQQIITYHRSWPYFANRFGLVIADELEPKPGVPPSPAHVLAVIDKVQAQKIKVILMEPFYDRKPADTVAEKGGAAVIVGANMTGGETGAGDYLAMINNVVGKVSATLGVEGR